MDANKLNRYPCVIQPLPEAEGGGYLAVFPDLPLVMSDGDTPTEALANGLDALKCALEALEEQGRTLPEPGQATGKMALRMPKSLHARLIARARAESVSINTAAVTLIAEGLGRGMGQDVPVGLKVAGGGTDWPLKMASRPSGDRVVYRNSVTGKFVAQTTHKNSRATSKRTKKV